MQVDVFLKKSGTGLVWSGQAGDRHFIGELLDEGVNAIRVKGSFRESDTIETRVFPWDSIENVTEVS